MERVLIVLSASALVAGCQAQNPYAMFGPPTIAAPTTTTTPPYYPPGGKADAAATAQIPAANVRPSVSASGPSIPLSRSPFVAEEADREPIRIVEDANAAARTAAANRAKASEQQSQPGVQPPRQSPAPANALPQPGAGGQKIGAGSLGEKAVVPAGHQQAVPAFREALPATGQWRAR